mmetsp:Transcript_18445/g.24464  ORF Transcript_18445/g.24464 Transcript_18445/m.24464 type:complete len:218 (-) Transcript_18445:63-716(-)
MTPFVGFRCGGTRGNFIFFTDLRREAFTFCAACWALFLRRLAGDEPAPAVPSVTTLLILGSSVTTTGEATGEDTSILLLLDDAFPKSVPTDTLSTLLPPTLRVRPPPVGVPLRAALFEPPSTDGNCIRTRRGDPIDIRGLQRPLLPAFWPLSPSTCPRCWACACAWSSVELLLGTSSLADIFVDVVDVERCFSEDFVGCCLFALFFSTVPSVGIDDS